MDIKPIHNDTDYRAALREVSKLVDLDPAIGTPDGDRLDILATLVCAWEAKHYPLTPPDPIEAIKFRMEQGGLTTKDMQTYLGGRSRVSEVLNHKRGLSLAMIRRLHSGLNIPLEVLIR